MPRLEYADAVIEYVQAQGWTANIIKLQEGAYMIGGARKTDDASEEMLLLVICEPMKKVEAKHLKYLIKTGHEENVDAAYVTYTVGITEAAKKIGRSHNISVIPSEKIRSYSKAGEFDTDTSGSTPDSDSDKRENPSQDSIIEERGEESEVRDGEIKDQKRNAKENSDDQVDTQDNRSNYSNEEEDRGINTEADNLSLSKQIETEYFQPDGQVVSGKLNLKDRHLCFKPNDPDELLSADEIEIPYCKMVDIDTKNRLSDDIKDILLDDGFQMGINIEAQNGNKFLFVVSHPTDVIADIESRVQEVKKSENNIEFKKRKKDSLLYRYINTQTRFRINRWVATALVLILIISGGAAISSGLGNDSTDARSDGELIETVDQPTTELLPVVDDFEDGWRGSRYTDGTATFAAPDGSPVVTYRLTVYNTSDKAQSGLEAANPENIATDSASIGSDGYTYQMENDRHITVFRDRNVVCSTTYVTDGKIPTPESTVLTHAEKCLESIRN